jgi:hypothetical protein
LRALPGDATPMRLRESIGNARRIFAATGTIAIAIVTLTQPCEPPLTWRT